MSQHSSASTSSSSAPVVTSGQTTVVPQFATDLSGIGPTAPSLSAPTYVVNPLSGMSNSSSDVTGMCVYGVLLCHYVGVCMFLPQCA